jgi:micrococcal nuclease
MTRTRLAILLTTAVVTAVLVVGAGRAPTAPPGGPGAATVVNVVDGDTIKVRMGRHVESVRLIGVDTPESVKPNSPVECFALEASAHTKELVPPGTAVRLVRDVEARDHYDRLLAYVYRQGDGLFVNLALAQNGYAAPLTIAPNVAYAADFAAAAAQARQAQRGLWAACAGPHEPKPDGAPP